MTNQASWKGASMCQKACSAESLKPVERSGVALESARDTELMSPRVFLRKDCET